MADGLTVEEFLAAGGQLKPAQPTTPKTMSVQDFLAAGGTMRQEQTTLGAAGRSLVKGIGDLGGMVAQAVPIPFVSGSGGQGLGQALAEWLTDKPVTETTMEKVQNLRRSLVDDPVYETAAGRIAGKAIEAAPMAIVSGGTSLLPRAAATIENMIAGAGGQIAEEAGYNPLLGSLTASGLTSLAKTGAGALLRPLSETGRKEIAAETARTAIGSKGVENIKAATPETMATGLYDDAGKAISKSTAEVAGTPGAAHLQKTLAMENNDLGNAIMADLEKRAVARGQTLDELADTALKNARPEERGQALRSLVIDASDEADKGVKEAWKSAQLSSSKFPIAQASAEILDEAASVGGVIPLSANAKYVINQFKEAVPGLPKNTTFTIKPTAKTRPARSISVEQYQRIRSAAGRQFSIAARKGDLQEARMMAIVRSKLDDAAMEAAEGTSAGTSFSGISKESLEGLQNAIGKTREFKQKYDSGIIGKILKEDSKEFKMGASRVPKAVTGTPEAAQEVATKFGSSPEIMAETRGALLDELGRAKDKVSKLNYLQKNEGQFKAAFQDQYPTVQKIIKDLDSEISVDRLRQMATGRGSISTQGITSAQFLANADTASKVLKQSGAVLSGVFGVGGSLAGNPISGAAGAIAGGVIGSKVAALAQKSEQEIKSILTQAMRDPEVMQALISTPSRTTLETIMNSAPVAAAIGAVQEKESKNTGRAKEVFQDATGQGFSRSEVDSGLFSKPSSKVDPKLFSRKEAKDMGSDSIAASTVSLVKKFEGKSLKAYKDSGGVQTIGYGHTGEGVKKGKITEAEATEYLKKDLEKAASAVDTLVTVPISQEQKDALISLTYNIGSGAFKRSSLLEKINAEDFEGAADEFNKWVFDNGKKIPGLVTRRKQESELFRSGIV